MKQKKRKKKAPFMRAPELVDGEAFWVKNSGWLHCCDCGKRHHITIEREISKTRRGSLIEENKDWLLLKFYSDDLGTERIRYEKGVTLTTKGKKK